MKNKQPEGKAENKWGQSKTLTPFILSIPWTSLYSESVMHVTAAYRPSMDMAAECSVRQRHTVLPWT